jgi:hypothetical protein
MEHFVAYHNVEKIGGPFITKRKGQADTLALEHENVLRNGIA